MDAKIELGRIWGIPIRLHPSWFLVFGLSTWSLAMGFFPEGYSGLPTAAYWLLGALTSILFFGSVLVHELAHAFFALRNEIPVRGITLFIFGGVAQIEKEPCSPGAECRIAIAGPLASLGLAGLFGGLWLLCRHVSYLAAPNIWLARINLTLAVFNMIPGFPLDGGRILRSLVWHFTGSFYRATQVAASTGQLVALGFVSLGVFTIFTGSLFNGLWLAFIGWFLQNAAVSSQTWSSVQQSLRGVVVGQVMGRDYPTVSSLLPVSQLIEERILTGAQRCFLVTDKGHLRGLLTLRDIAAIPQRKRRYVTVREVMVPFERLARVQPHTELLAALRTMDDANVAQVPVVEGDEIVGILSREQVIHYIRLRAELGV
ncbi:MAG: site-2 protease family protein [Chloroflexota bacterium]|nr:site-2 protease family protein [Anaerolineae bacterium]